MKILNIIPSVSPLRGDPSVAGSGTPEFEAELNRLTQEHHLDDLTHKLGFVSGEKKYLLARI